MAVPSPIRARGFTLVEILISLTIFLVVSTAMVGILFLASDLYRQGESSRAATDEAVAVLAALDGDLLRMAPAIDDGWMLLAKDDPSGNCIAAWSAKAKDSSSLSVTGHGARELVIWRINDQETLQRLALDDSLRLEDFLLATFVGQSTTTTPTASLDQVNFVTLDSSGAVASRKGPSAVIGTHPGRDLVREFLQGDDGLEIVATIDGTSQTKLILPNDITPGCLHFGTYAAPLGDVRSLDDQWLRTESGAGMLPTGGSESIFATGTANPDLPEALCLVVGLTGGGRFSPTGFLIQDNGSSLRIGGIRAMPTLPGSMVRVGNEWIGYDRYANGTIFCGGTDPWVGRTRRRSAAVTIPANIREVPVRWARTWTLVRPLPR